MHTTLFSLTLLLLLSTPSLAGDPTTDAIDAEILRLNRELTAARRKAGSKEQDADHKAWRSRCPSHAGRTRGGGAAGEDIGVEGLSVVQSTA